MSRSAADLPRLFTAAGLVVLALLSWLLLARSAAVMSAMEGDGLLLDAAIAMMQPAPAGSYLAVTALMWMIMMIAMMAPAVLPVTLVFQRLDRGAAGRATGRASGPASGRGAADRASSLTSGRGAADGALFAGGYLVVWFAFAIAATLLQWGLHRAALLHSHVMSVGPAITASILIGAGVYQLTPYKRACLRHCQSPVSFLLSHWAEGRSGALRMGARHGLYCLGCCWALMLLMFAGGVMSVATMAVLSVFVLAERLLPPGPWSSTLPGFVLIAWGVWTLALLAP